MGLTLHYTLGAPAALDDDAVPALVRAMRAVAERFRRAGRVAAVSPVSATREDLEWCTAWLPVRAAGGVRGLPVPPHAGRLFFVDLGEGAEPLRLGLCAYPESVDDPGNGRPRRVRLRGWRLRAFCKTHYASLHGWEHFLRTHTAAIDLLLALRPLGLRVTLLDEGGYWPGRDTVALRAQLDRLNGAIAGLAGALKDATDDTRTAPVRSPIFAHPEFERLEAAGASAHAADLARAVALIRPPGGD